MLILLNSTKTMDLAAPVPAGLRATRPAFGAEAAAVVAALRPRRPAELARLMDLSGALADAAKVDLARWGDRRNPARPALLAFTGLVFRYLDAPSLDADGWRRAQDRLRILSGLYGVLRPRDRIEAYRLEMGLKWAPKGTKDMAGFWREKVTARLNRDLRRGEPVLSVSSVEYLAAVDTGALKGPVIRPVFKERRPDGSLRTAPVHAKMARGALARWALDSRAGRPADLMEFAGLGWEAAEEPPPEGPWLFTRTVRS